ncbi:Methionine aminopeptidase 2B [Camellia lanceoleosa]|nr:Methionine aminopeptidase 2B [Camellia lanceoleosa]
MMQSEVVEEIIYGLESGILFGHGLETWESNCSVHMRRYSINCDRVLAEKRELEHLEKPIYNSVSRAAKVYHQVRKYIKGILKPGMLMIDLCETLENTVRKLIWENSLQAGIAFPTRCSLNW